MDINAKTSSSKYLLPAYDVYTLSGVRYTLTLEVKGRISVFAIIYNWPYCRGVHVFNNVLEVAPGRGAGVCLFAAYGNVESFGVVAERIRSAVVGSGVGAKRIDIFQA